MNGPTGFSSAWKKYNEIRALGVLENRPLSDQLKLDHPEWFGDGWYAMMNRVNFFTCLDERDSAQAIEKGLLGSYEGHHPLFVNDDQNWTGIPTRTLIDLFYPDVTRFKKTFSGTDTLVNIDRAPATAGLRGRIFFWKVDDSHWDVRCYGRE